MTTEAPRLYTIYEAAARLKISQRTLYRMIEEGQAHPTRIRSRVFISIEELQRIQREGTGGVTTGR